MNCNVAWYLQSGSCLPLWINIVFFVCVFLVGLLWADLVVYRAKHVIMFLFFVLAMLLYIGYATQNKKLTDIIEHILKKKP